jgi:hypothetical protein
MMTTNLIATVKSETRLLVLASLRAQLLGVDAVDLHVALAKRLEDVFAQHLAAPIRDAVDSALTATIHAAVDHSLVSTLDAALDHAVDGAISSAVDSLTDLARDHAMATEALPEEEPVVLVMADAAQITSPVEEPATLETTATEARPEPAATMEAQTLPASEDVSEDAVEPDHSALGEPGGTSDTSLEVADAIRRLHSEGRSVRSISRTLKVRELQVRLVLVADQSSS